MKMMSRSFLFAALCVVSSAHAGLLDWFKGAPTYQAIADVNAHPVLKKTKVSIDELEAGFENASVKLEDGSFSTFKKIADGQFVLRWQKKDDPSKTIITRVFADRESSEHLLPEAGQIAAPEDTGEPTYFVYYGSPSNKLFQSLLPK